MHAVTDYIHKADISAQEGWCSHPSVITTRIQLRSLVWPDPFSAGRLSIRDYKRPLRNHTRLTTSCATVQR